MISIVLHVCCFLLLTEGSVIVFEATPTVIKDGLTESLHLRCSVNDTESPTSGAIVGRGLTTNTDTDIHQLFALLVTKDGKEIATVSEIVAAKALNASANVKVTGDVTNGLGERGYIDIVLENPTHDHSGEYVCEANAVTDLGHGVQFSKAVEVAISQPTIPDLLNKMKEQEKRLDILNHTETGFVQCGSSSSWTQHGMFQGSATQAVDITQNFRKAYEHPPVVKLGIVNLDLYNAHNTRVITSLVHVDKTSLTVRCETWAGSVVYYMAVTWISVAN